ncbi:hypothetical protein GJV85_12555 [Sulfurimonas aquatica]|uniref:Uncharacterized protein n=1 Tax=Sulfurimonas aquatica TaxID=2672570 RepID=A0A975B2G9_9BACT|nr:hypothetical protein [Sulfurimonas aquatica]QSZ42903.1 hypothetical protein GJV85_12555 [Sulfurimonas aquatica]
MTYKNWFDEHAIKHKNIVKKLTSQGYDKEQITQYFDFDNMVKNEKDFCLLYESNKKCHDIETLNCYLCACPHFRFNDNGLSKKNEQTLYSKCELDLGDNFTYENSVHHDCTNCLIPHKLHFVSKTFDLEWKNIMSECETKEEVKI